MKLELLLNKDRRTALRLMGAAEFLQNDIANYSKKWEAGTYYRPSCNEAATNDGENIVRLYLAVVWDEQPCLHTINDT
ncbi:unnamed protein product [Citrullus colocynthis]|uniref:Uncharacterized protein n=1 Tax=Citrullus colocynthis TaxID=252529 RepID=A0ABP0XPA9_9ROSI